MKNKKHKLRLALVSLVVMVSIMAMTSTAFAAEELSGPSESVASVGADYLIDTSNQVFIYQNGQYVLIDSDVQTRGDGFGESNASWITHLVQNGNTIYTVKHKGWKERQSSTSLYGVRACSKTTCSPTKNHWTRARMTSTGGVITYTDSGQCWSTATATARSPYYNCHVSNAVMRSTWGGVGTVIS